MDQNLDVKALESWRDDVQNELEAVDKVLAEVAKVCQECTGDDTVYGAFKKMGEDIANAYLGLCGVYRKTIEETNGIIDIIKKKVNNIGNKFQEFVEGFHL